MNRCSPRHLELRPSRLLAAACCGWLLASALPAYAQQVQPSLGLVRNFPDAALRGSLTVASTVEAKLNGKAIRMAPGMRLFSPQNSLVPLHTVIGQPFKVNYVLEPSTGMLISAWILTKGEAEQPRKGSDTVDRNFRTESDTAVPALR